jgi:nicotinamidase-related amidase
VESTARSAFDHGYSVVLVIDAMTDRDLDAHRWLLGCSRFRHAILSWRFRAASTALNSLHS